MIRLFWMGLIIPLLLLTSCGEEDETNVDGLSVAMQSKAFILPGVGNSCVAINSIDSDSPTLGDISEFRVTLSNLKLTWTRTAQDLIFAYIRIEINHPNVGGEYTASIDGVELDLLLGTANGRAPAATYAVPDGQPASAPKVLTPTIMDSSSDAFVDPEIGFAKVPCSLAFGGLNIPDDTPFFTTDAEVTIVAIARGNDKVQDDLAPGEVPVSSLTEEAIKFETKVTLEFDF